MTHRRHNSTLPIGKQRSFNSTMPPSKKPMNRTPPKEPKARTKFRKSVWLCQACGRKADKSRGVRLECHEIASGGSRAKALAHPSCLLMLCGVDLVRGRRGCHRVVQDWSLAMQLALKKWSDPERYDRREVLGVKGWAETAVTEEEVDALVAVVGAVDWMSMEE